MDATSLLLAFTVAASNNANGRRDVYGTEMEGSVPQQRHKREVPAREPAWWCSVAVVEAAVRRWRRCGEDGGGSAVEAAEAVRR